MTKELERHSVSDSELGSVVAGGSASKLGAVLCPAACALLVVLVFAATFLATKLAYDQYDSFCASGGRRFDVAKLYIFPNLTMKVEASA